MTIVAKPHLTRLVLSFWAARGNFTAWVFSLLVILCTVISVILTLLLNKWQAGFYNQLQQYNFAGFLDTLVHFLLIAGIYVLISGYHAYFRLVLQIRWRQWLTKQYVDLWLHNRTYYHLNLLGSIINNPAQRISEDIALFVDNTLDLVIGLLRHTVALAAFSVVLWQLSGTLRLEAAGYEWHITGYLVWAAFLYSMLGTWLTIRIGRPLVHQSVVRQTAEAEFRAGLDRVREHDECIILYGGETKEKFNLGRHFQKITANCLQIAKSTRNITLLTSTYAQFSVVFAFMVAAPRYFNHEIQLGQLFEISGAYWYVHNALSYIVDSFSKVAFWKALVRRLTNFNTAIAAVQRTAGAQGTIGEHRGTGFAVTGLTVNALSGDPLINNLTISLKAGDRLLISGPTGSGKTTLFRTLAGIWPNFSGQILKPAGKQLMFLPQRPYFPVDSLRNVLLYPQLNCPAEDKQLQEILRSCKLPELAKELNRSEDWGKALSSGEQQCLSIARAILHRPEWLFMDEATSSLDSATEQYLYCLLQTALRNTALISIGHRDTLHCHHTLSLQINADGGWELGRRSSGADHWLSPVNR